MSDLTTTTLDHAGRRRFSASGRPGSEQAFRRAVRHSRVVRVLRVAASVGLATVICGLLLVAWFEPLRMLKALPASVDRVVVSGSKITMAAPKLSGFTNDARKYDLAARAATQDVTQPNIVDLEGIVAKFETVDKTKLDLTASDGVYNRNTGMLVLRRNVVLVTSTGYEVRLNEIRVDTASGDIFSDSPVEIDMLQGTLKAKRIEVLKSGDVVNFDGGVSMVLNMNEQQQQPQPKKPGTP